MENLTLKHTDNDLAETAYLLSNPANAKHLMDSIAQDKSNQVCQINLTELDVNFDKEK